MKLWIPFALVGALLLSGSDSAMAADKDLSASTKIAAAKARTRAFNPFATKKTRLKMNGFGVFVAVPEGELYDSLAVSKLSTPAATAPVVSLPVAATSTATSIAAVAAPAALPPITANATVTIPAATTAIAVATGGSLSSSMQSDLSLATGAVRDPYRPPVRSPFRPPPRPPF